MFDRLIASPPPHAPCAVDLSRLIPFRMFFSTSNATKSKNRDAQAMREKQARKAAEREAKEAADAAGGAGAKK